MNGRLWRRGIRSWSRVRRRWRQPTLSSAPRWGRWSRSWTRRNRKLQRGHTFILSAEGRVNSTLVHLMRCFIGEMLCVCVQGWEDSAAVQGWRGESCPDGAHAGAHVSHRATHQPASAAHPTARVLHFKQYDWKLHNNLHEVCRSWLLLTPVHPQVKAGWSQSGGVSCAGMLHFCLQRERQAGGKSPEQAWRTEEIGRK